MAKRLKDIDLYQNYLKWVSGAGDFRCFFRSPNFVSLKHYPDFELQEPAAGDAEDIERIISIVRGYDSRETLIVLDLSGSLSLDVAYLLLVERELNPILVFNGILHPFGLIGDREYIKKLLGYGELIRMAGTGGFVFVLDYGRYGDYSDEQLKSYFNNQYELGEEDLPSAEMLSELGYKSLLYICETQPKDDVEGYLEYLAESNILVFKEAVKGEQKYV